MLSFEVFAAKDPVSGSLQGILMSVPVNCGLVQADTLRLNGSQLLALEKGSVLAIDFPPLDEASKRDVEETMKAHGAVAVAEFSALGMVDNYLLKLEQGHASSRDFGEDD
ncbi:hypothetical protein [Comamonas testosteroni]|jgi:hypothetical protein|uniref:hypothetical protein n=1 Tax=Comamonas testosteroni TaxID=285 RepID=UPI0026EAEFE6|nr:hypothetical protein [Comamonas testosteroni]